MIGSDIIKNLRIKIKNIFKLIRKPEMRVLPGNLAFFFMLSLLPMLSFAVLIGSFFSISLETIVSSIEGMLPEMVSNVIIDIINGKGFTTETGLFTIFGLFIASNGMYSVINVSNVLYEVENSDPLKDRIKSIIMLVLIIFLFIFLLIVPIFGEQLLTLIKNNNILKHISNELILFFNIIKWPLSFLIIYFNIKVIYTLSPSKKIKSKTTTSGSLFTTCFWIIATLIFSIYLNNFARYDILYGNLSNIIILMVWLYLLAYIFVLGMAVNTTKD